GAARRGHQGLQGPGGRPGRPRRRLLTRTPRRRCTPEKFERLCHTGGIVSRSHRASVMCSPGGAAVGGPESWGDSCRSSVPAAGLAALVLAAGAVGCSKGSESPSMSPVAAVARAAKSSEDLTSFRYTMTGKVPEQGRVEAEASMQVKPDIAMSMKMTALDR